jgi:hypothetical protein
MQTQEDRMNVAADRTAFARERFERFSVFDLAWEQRMRDEIRDLRMARREATRDAIAKAIEAKTVEPEL